VTLRCPEGFPHEPSEYVTRMEICATADSSKVLATTTAEPFFVSVRGVDAGTAVTCCVHFREGLGAASERPVSVSLAVLANGEVLKTAVKVPRLKMNPGFLSRVVSE
jgi:hypothetical protein